MEEPVERQQDCLVDPALWPAARVVDALGVDREVWEEHAQSFELEWWVDTDLTRSMIAAKDDPALLNRLQRKSTAGHAWLSGQILSEFGFTQRQYAGKRVLEVGCGPTGRTLWFEDAAIEAFEPLAAQFCATVPWAEFMHFDKVYSAPIETHIPELNETFDAVLSFNCLDHCYDLRAALRNIRRYLRPGGTAFLSFDVDNYGHDPTHPVSVSHRTAHHAMQDVGFSVVKVDCGHCYPKPDGTWLDSWGGGRAWHWWLEKPQVCYPVAALPNCWMRVPRKETGKLWEFDESADEAARDV